MRHFFSRLAAAIGDMAARHLKKLALGGTGAESGHYNPIARDLGSEIEIGSGLQADDRVIAAPPDGIAEGDQIRLNDAGQKPVATVAGSAKSPNRD